MQQGQSSDQSAGSIRSRSTGTPYRNRPDEHISPGSCGPLSLQDSGRDPPDPEILIASPRGSGRVAHPIVIPPQYHKQSCQIRSATNRRAGTGYPMIVASYRLYSFSVRIWFAGPEGNEFGPPFSLARFFVEMSMEGVEKAF